MIRIYPSAASQRPVQQGCAYWSKPKCFLFFSGCRKIDQQGTPKDIVCPFAWMRFAGSFPEGHRCLWHASESAVRQSHQLALLLAELHHSVAWRDGEDCQRAVEIT